MSKIPSLSGASPAILSRHSLGEDGSIYAKTDSAYPAIALATADGGWGGEPHRYPIINYGSLSNYFFGSLKATRNKNLALATNVSRIFQASKLL
jgi:hypothetical protein